jgi:hypothetical protein
MENYRDVVIGSELSTDQHNGVERLLFDFMDIFTDVPHMTSLGQHSTQLTTDEPIRGKAYALPHVTRDSVDKDIDFYAEVRHY